MAIMVAVGDLAGIDWRAWLTRSAVVGWLAVGLAALVLATRARGRGRAAWLGVAALMLLFSGELAFPRRYLATEALRGAMKAVGGEEGFRGRRPIQAATIAVVLVLAASGAIAARSFARRRPPSPASTVAPGVGLGLLGLLLETISLHQLDDYYLTYFALFNLGAILCAVGLARRFGDRAGPTRAPGPRPVADRAGGAHATYRLRDIEAAEAPGVDARERVGFTLAASCVLYVFGHGRVDGLEGLQFAGGLGSALLFGSAGAAAGLGWGSRSTARAAAFGLAFAVLGVSFNLAIHASSRPTWSADILQGLAIAAVAVAAWRGLTGGGPWAFAGLAALAASWWAFEPSARPFPGSQYLYASGASGISLFPAWPWLALAATGAALARASASTCSAAAIGLGLAAMAAWGGPSPIGPPVKFPLNPTYALLGASAISGAFAASGPALRWRPARLASAWLGRRWLVFFYIHLGIALVLARAGWTSPVACWPALAVLATTATWAIGAAADRLRPAFRTPWAWAVVAAATVAAGVAPGLPTGVVMALAWSSGLAFAALHDELAALILGPPTIGPAPVALGSPGAMAARLAVAAAVLIAPELARRLPPPLGLVSRPAIGAGPSPGVAP